MKAFIYFLSILILTFSLLTTIPANTETKVFGVEINEPLTAFIFLKNNECLGCSIFIQDCFDFFNNQKKIPAIAVVECKREIELKKFIKTYSWKSKCIVDKNYRHQNKLDKNTIVVLYSKDTKKMTSVKFGDAKSLEKIKNLIKKV